MLMVAGAWASPAGAQSIPVPAGCVIDSQRVPGPGEPPGPDTCESRAAGLDGVVETVVSPDGESLYAAAPKSLTTFRRDPATGSLSFAGCIEDDDVAPERRRCAETGEGLSSIFEIVVAPDGSSVYVLTGGLPGIVHFQRDGTSGLLTRTSCVADAYWQGDDDTCPALAPSLGSPAELLISPDGRFVYASSRLDGSIAWFARDPATGSLNFTNCIEAAGDGFHAGCDYFLEGLDSMPAMGMSPDGQMVYASSREDLVIGFSRDQNSGRLRPVTCIQDRNQSDGFCANKGEGAYAINDIAVSPDGRYVYTAGQNRVWALEYDAVTQSLDPIECVEDGPTPTGSCRDTARGMYQIRDISLSSDGAYLFGVSPHVVNGAPAEDALVVFERDSDSGELAPGSCIDDNGNLESGSPSGTDSCDLAVDGLENAFGVTTSPDDSFIYVAAEKSDAIAIFGSPPNPDDLTITHAPSGLTNEQQPSFEFAHAPEASVQCSLDQGVASFGPCSGPGVHTAAAPLADGSYVFRVRTEPRGSVPATARLRRFSVDTVEPQTISLDEPSRTSSSFNVGFGYRSPEPATFECRLLSRETAWRECGAGTAYRLPNGTHRFEARAIDRAGNRDSSPISSTVVVQVDRPFVRIDTAPFLRTSDTTPAFGFMVGPDAIHQCLFERIDADDDAEYAPCSEAGAHQVASPVANGRYRFSVRAQSTLNGSREVQSVEFVIQADEPWAAITGKPRDPTSDPTPTFSFSAGGDVLTCSLTAAGSEAQPHPCSDVAGHTPESPLSDGPHTFTVRAEGPTGASAQDSYAFVVDTSSPETLMDGAPAASVDSEQSTFEFRADELGTSFECSLQGPGRTAPWSACSSPSIVDHPTAGTYRFAVRSRDAAGNADPTPAQHDFVVRPAPVEPGPPEPEPPSGNPPPPDSESDDAALIDPPELALTDTSAPQTIIERGPRPKATDRTPRIVFSTTEGREGMSFECSLDRSRFEDCESPLELKPRLDPGRHRFAVRATDAAGNADPTAATVRFRIRRNT